MNRKLKVLLVMPDFDSGIGAMGKHLATSVKNVDHYFFISSHFNLHKDEFLKLIATVDIVHWLSNLSWTKMPADIDIRKFPIPNIATIHHVDENIVGFGAKEESEKISAASQADMIHVESTEWLDYVQQRTTTPVYLAHQSINPKQFHRNRSRKRPGFPFQIGTFGFAKELNDRKRIDVLLAALMMLKQKGYLFDLVVQGPHWDTLKLPFTTNGINVINLGFPSSRKALQNYRKLDLYVCSSEVEGGPLPVLEALASGVPVVSTRVGLAIDALTMGGGILVDKGDSEQMASAIAELIDNKAKYQHLVKQSIQVAEQFSNNRIGEEYLSLYHNAITIKGKVNSKKRLFLPAHIQRSIQLVKNVITESSSYKKIQRMKNYFDK